MTPNRNRVLLKNKGLQVVLFYFDKESLLSVQCQLSPLCVLFAFNKYTVWIGNRKPLGECGEHNGAVSEGSPGIKGQETETESDTED